MIYSFIQERRNRKEISLFIMFEDEFTEILNDEIVNIETDKKDDKIMTKGLMRALYLYKKYKYEKQRL